MELSSVEDVLEAVQGGGEPPAAISPELRSLWLAKLGQWDAAHDIAQDIDTPLGPWIHAHLHLLEGDLGNARYWYNRAGKPARGRGEEDEGWAEIVGEVLARG